MKNKSLVSINDYTKEDYLKIIEKAAEFEKNPLAEEIIKNHLHKVEKNAFKEIAKDLNVSVEEVNAAIDFIRTLEPKPGRAYNTVTTQYIQPDVYIYKVGDDYRIVLNERGLPKLKINRLYQNYKKKGVDQKTKKYVEQKF
jgi:RNA polymerase sigma-54 factor